MATITNKIILWLATGFGTGYLPWAPGSWGAAAAAIMGWWLVDLPFLWYLLIIFALTVIGFGVSPAADRYLSIKSGKKYDNSQIVIDEWVGMLITLLPFYFFEKSILYLVIGFLMFRIFDTLKFGLAKLADQWRHSGGVMLDDIVAGLHSGIFFFIALWVMEKF
ncbi:phosphatidylglycerophosphatase A [Patescibacteria group bacterium]|nr:phosphatidylglycerophosphatase A [Patescibacteria group bacterium]